MNINKCGSLENRFPFNIEYNYLEEYTEKNY